MTDPSPPEEVGDQVDVPSKTASAVPATAPLSRHVYSGHALTAEEGNMLSGAQRARLISLVGPTGSGKTTLILSIYEAFRHARFGGTMFAGSRTLLGFEERCHLSRAASEGHTPDTERTKSENEEVLLHLRVQPEALEMDPINLLFCDLSGELFDAAGETNEALLRIPFLQSARHIAMFVDGERLIDAAMRHAVRQEFLTLLRAGIEVGRIGKSTNVQLVFSKQDLIRRANNRHEVQVFQSAIRQTCIDQFASRLRSLAFYEVALRPRPDEGLTTLYKAWIAENDKPVPGLFSPNQLAADREIDRFAEREVKSGKFMVSAQ